MLRIHVETVQTLFIDCPPEKRLNLLQWMRTFTNDNTSAFHVAALEIVIKSVEEQIVEELLVFVNE